jgi:EAL domain-containing protein (putative c-di-GMP-specific phosphodiesterase class I)
MNGPRLYVCNFVVTGIFLQGYYMTETGKTGEGKPIQQVIAISPDIDFEYAYQPIVDLTTQSVFAHEALVRGPHGEPAFFILSQVNDRNRYSFDQACRVRAVTAAANLGMKEPLSINFFPNTGHAEVSIRGTLEAAQRCNFPIGKIIFEVSEAEQVRDRSHLAGIFSEYQRSGCLTAIDDFGAGYAGLNLLAEYQPDIIKVDMGLVRGIDSCKPRQTIVRGLIDICANLGKRILAEGIETRAERDFLYSAGIHLMQGYLFCKPAFRAIGEVDPSSWH